MNRLKYKGILLRRATREDAGQLAAWWNDGSVMAHAGYPNGLGITEEDVAAGLGEGALILEKNGMLIGEACYRRVGEDVAEIGIKICEADYQNRGIGRVALSLLIRNLFDHGFSKIILDTNLSNKRAQHVYESLGFRKLRVNVDAWKDQLGNKQSSVDYELIPEDFVSYISETSRFEVAYGTFLEEFGKGKPMVLSTCEGSRVTSRMMSVVQLDGAFYFQTDRTFRKYAQLKANPRAALCIDNIQIEGICEELGHPKACPAFSEAYRACFAGSYERYSHLDNERVFALRPAFIERWVYRDGEPFVEMFDVERGAWKVEAYNGV